MYKRQDVISPYLEETNKASACFATWSNALNPILCLVLSYFKPGLPSPTIKNFKMGWLIYSSFFVSSGALSSEDPLLSPPSPSAVSEPSSSSSSSSSSIITLAV